MSLIWRLSTVSGPKGVFVNPHVIFAGDKDNVNEALQVMFHKAMKMPVLKDLPDKLF
ncbi:Uncharacterised protein [Mycobacteroides abscessus subsp. abscessus]|nr:Uncharacterised protein [Mycobacteroides abscessus subsp. abscessus]